jgi:hypothetical protein
MDRIYQPSPLSLHFLPAFAFLMTLFLLPKVFVFHGHFLLLTDTSDCVILSQDTWLVLSPALLTTISRWQ